MADLWTDQFVRVAGHQGHILQWRLRVIVQKHIHFCRVGIDRADTVLCQMGGIRHRGAPVGQIAQRNDQIVDLPRPVQRHGDLRVHIVDLDAGLVVDRRGRAVGEQLGHGEGIGGAHGHNAHSQRLIVIHLSAAVYDVICQICLGPAYDGGANGHRSVPGCGVGISSQLVNMDGVFPLLHLIQDAEIGRLTGRGTLPLIDAQIGEALLLVHKDVQLALLTPSATRCSGVQGELHGGIRPDQHIPAQVVVIDISHALGIGDEVVVDAGGVVSGTWNARHSLTVHGQLIARAEQHLGKHGGELQIAGRGIQGVGRGGQVVHPGQMEVVRNAAAQIHRLPVDGITVLILLVLAVQNDLHPAAAVIQPLHHSVAPVHHPVGGGVRLPDLHLLVGAVRGAGVHGEILIQRLP